MLNPSGLICPLDQTPLQLKERRLQCLQGHDFDLAKQGYCHLLPVQNKRSKDPGDSKAMVAARSKFLDSGIYQPIADFMLQQVLPLLLEQSGENRIADAGCGEGYYLDLLEQSCTEQGREIRCIGYDISKWAVLRATRRSNRISWLVASNRQPPIEPDYLDLILCMFGYVQFEAFACCLKTGGYLVLVDAGPEHLIELRERIYDQVKPARPYDQAEAKAAGYELISEQALKLDSVMMDAAQLEQLMLMTPHFFRATAEAKNKLQQLKQLELTLDVVCRIYQLK